MFLKSTPEELRQELSDLVDDLKVDLFNIELLLQHPDRSGKGSGAYLAAVHRADCFLMQHTSDICTVGGMLLEYARQRANTSNPDDPDGQHTGCLSP